MTVMWRLLPRAVCSPYRSMVSTATVDSPGQWQCAPPPAVRDTFDLDAHLLRKWFPPHMARALRRMRRLCDEVHAVIEVHDARLALTGRNVLLDTERFAPHAPRLLCINKADLISAEHRSRVERALTRAASDREGASSTTRLLWTAFKHTSPQKTCDEIMRAVGALLLDDAGGAEDASADAAKQRTRTFTLMVVGIPNVGKSTLINAMRRRYHGVTKDATKTGALPGVTRTVSTRIRVHTAPDVFVVDTPGVVQPHVADTQTALKLALCATLADTVIERYLVADYLLWRLNRWQRWPLYGRFFHLTQGVDDARQLALHICRTRGYTKQIVIPGKGKQTVPDLERAYQTFITAFHEGHFGDQFLDDDLLTE